MSDQASNSIKLSDNLTLFSGQLITLKADDNTFLKRYNSIGDNDALLCWEKEIDDSSKFTLEVANASNLTIRLKADNGGYCKRFWSWENKNIIATNGNPDEKFSIFTVVPLGENKINLKADNGEYLKRFWNYED